jgi:hypothetical protein
MNVGKAEDDLFLLETNGSRGGLARKERVREAGIACPRAESPRTRDGQVDDKGIPPEFTPAQSSNLRQHLNRRPF